MPLRVAEKPGGVVTVRPDEVLVAVWAGEFEGEGSVGAGGVAEETAWKPGLKGREAPGQGGTAGARVEGEVLGRGLGGEALRPRG